VADPKASLQSDSDLLTYRLRLGLTLRQMSKKTGLSPATLHRLERGLVSPTPRSRVRLQDMLGLAPEQVESLLAMSLKRAQNRIKINKRKA